jgi:hypothetical protein
VARRNPGPPLTFAVFREARIDDGPFMKSTVLIDKFQVHVARPFKNRREFSACYEILIAFVPQLHSDVDGWAIDVPVHDPGTSRRVQ